MTNIISKHFQYNGIDDFNEPLDEQMNKFFEINEIKEEDIISITYSSHSSAEGNSNYSALLVYRVK